MDLRLLGPVEARLDGRPIALGAPKQRAVLAMLALEAGRTVSVDRLVEGLWGEQPPSSAPKMVQLYVSHLRRLLEGNGAQIVTRARGYELQLGGGAVDAVQFERLIEQSRAREALALWHGDALADVADEPFAAAEIRRLGALRVRAAETAINADLAAGRDDEVIGELEPLIDEYPLRERLHAQRMLALYRAGRQSEALNAYREARAVLVEQIGVEPGAELKRLHEAILAQDPALARIGTTEGTRLAPPPTATVGRDGDLEAIAAALSESRLVTLTGPGGVGKTRLALEAARRHRHEVYIARLATVAESADVLAALAAAVQAPPRLGESIASGLVRRLGGDHALLVADNFEHVLPGRASADRATRRLSRAACSGDEPRAAAATR
jgi:DNA-binding SARP family transcriptional activator